MPATERNLAVDDDVRCKRAPGVGLRAEQDRLPERGDPRDVCLEVQVRDVGEDEADHAVTQRTRVERAHEPFAVAALLDVRQRVGHVSEDRARLRRAPGLGGVADMQASGGVIDHAVYQAEGDPTNVLVMHEFGSADEAHAFFENADLREAMQNGGVDPSSLRLEFYERT